MTNHHPDKVTRRKFLTLTGNALAAGGATLGQRSRADAISDSVGATETEAFWGRHQGGIITPCQRHTYYAVFDLAAAKRDDVTTLLKEWTAASARMTSGLTAKPLDPNIAEPGTDSGETLGLSPKRLTVTFGFGAGVFVKDGVDRYGLKDRRPAALVDLPRFNGDQLINAKTDGDISIQACSDDPQVAFHAVRELARLAYGAAQIRWSQTGFLPDTPSHETPRNLMGYKDGTNNPATEDPASMSKFVWVGSEGPAWMQGGSYLVVRRIRMALEHWDRMPVRFQEQTMGRHKYSGAPLGCTHERDAVNLSATDKDGNPIIADNAHVRLAAAASNGGAKLFRRPYSYNDGLSFTSERWPPWRQGMEYDAGLLFITYQRDPRTGFIQIYDQMSKIDMLNQFVTHNGSGVFACPRGAKKGEYIGQALIEIA